MKLNMYVRITSYNVCYTKLLRGHLLVRTNRGEGLEQRFGIPRRDPILENARRDEPDALRHGELIAMRRE